MSGMFRPLEKRPVGRCVGKSIPYGGESARALVARKLLLPLSTKESPNTKNARPWTRSTTLSMARSRARIIATTKPKKVEELAIYGDRQRNTVKIENNKVLFNEENIMMDENESG